jgi:death-on-curing family protein
MKIKSLTVEEVQYVAHSFAQKFLEWDEPIPDFSTRYPNILERCLDAPHQTFEGQLYKGLIKKAAMLFYLLIKNHPFQNGNKRIAVVTLMIFLAKNHKWLTVSNQELYNFAKWVAESNAKLNESTVGAVEEFLGVYMSGKNKKGR